MGKKGGEKGSAAKGESLRINASSTTRRKDMDARNLLGKFVNGNCHRKGRIIYGNSSVAIWDFTRSWPKGVKKK